MTAYSTTQIAKIVGVTRQTIYNWLSQGIVEEPPRDYRGRRLFNDQHLKTMLTHKNRILPPTPRGK